MAHNPSEIEPCVKTGSFRRSAYYGIGYWDMVAASNGALDAQLVYDTRQEMISNTQRFSRTWRVSAKK